MEDIRQVSVSETVQALADRLTLVLAATPGVETEDVGSALGLMGKDYALAWMGLDELEEARWLELTEQARTMMGMCRPGEYTVQELTWIAAHLLGSMAETARWARAGGHACEGV